MSITYIIKSILCQSSRCHILDGNCPFRFVDKYTELAKTGSLSQSELFSAAAEALKSDGIQLVPKDEQVSSQLIVADHLMHL